MSDVLSRNPNPIFYFLIDENLFSSILHPAVFLNQLRELVVTAALVVDRRHRERP